MKHVTVLFEDSNRLLSRAPCVNIYSENHVDRTSLKGLIGSYCLKRNRQSISFKTNVNHLQIETYNMDDLDRQMRPFVSQLSLRRFLIPFSFNVSSSCYITFCINEGYRNSFAFKD